jgi:GUN4-like
MSKILIETSANQFQDLDSSALKSSLDQLANLVNQIGQNGTGGLELDEITIAIKVSAQSNVILINESDPAGAITLKFKRFHQIPIQSPSSQISYPPVNYQKLENLLANAQWQEANQETWNILCTTLHKHQGTPLTALDIEQIPCASINNIDKLWHKYSNGKFGFTVQSRIYKES